MKQLLTLLFLLSCAGVPRVRQPLLDQEIRVRPEGFTNQICTKHSASGVCEIMDRVVYDLADEATRQRLIEVKLICSVGGVRFRVMQAEPCLYRTHTDVKRFIGIPVKRTLVIDEKLCMPGELQKLLDRKTYCAPQGSVSERGMQWN
jgi:hypothetical protein